MAGLKAGLTGAGNWLGEAGWPKNWLPPWIEGSAFRKAVAGVPAGGMPLKACEEPAGASTVWKA